MTSPAMTKRAQSDWPELLSDLFREMTKHDTVIEFDELMVWVPVTSHENTPHAPWKLKGRVRVHSAAND